VDNAGHLFIADAGAGDERIREVTLATGTIATVAGCGGNGGFGGDLGPATDARLNDPTGVAVDAAGNLYIADSGNERIRAVYTDGVINTIAGCGGSGGFGGDTFPATGAQFNHPNGLAVDASGNIYVADTGNDCIREVFARTGIINTVAGTGTTLGYSGDNGLAVAATLDSPEGVAVDASGNLFIADTNNHRIREVTHGNGVITTVAGDGVAG
jgi:sugar lactone lactonase YvrE